MTPCATLLVMSKASYGTILDGSILNGPLEEYAAVMDYWPAVMDASEAVALGTGISSGQFGNAGLIECSKKPPPLTTAELTDPVFNEKARRGEFKDRREERLKVIRKASLARIERAELEQMEPMDLYKGYVARKCQPHPERFVTPKRKPRPKRRPVGNDTGFSIFRRKK